MDKKLRDIVWDSEYLYFIKINKPDKRSKDTWTFKINDSRHFYHNLSGKFSDYNIKTVQMRQDDCFFIAYKIDFGNNIFDYFVDTRAALYRTSVEKYVNSLIDFQVFSNDISFDKKCPSFKIGRNEMKAKGIDNFIDLCWEFRNYTSIGTGLTRNKRNLVILDIDVDCRREDYAWHLQDLMMKLALMNTLPDFKVVNHSNGHIQLQWLIQDYTYKVVSKKVVTTLTKELKSERKDGEMKHKVYDFLEKSKWNGQYKLFTMALTDIVPKNKFGDKNYTFWKAKNPLSALEGVNNLELQMPYYSGGEIRYLTRDEMLDEFSSKESRRNFYEEAPSLNEIYERMKDVIQPLMDNLNKEKIVKKKDDDEIEIREAKKQKTTNTFGKARNSFVFNISREVAWEVCRKYGLKDFKSVSKMPPEDQSRMRKEALKLVRKRFKEEDKKYGGQWPDTGNNSVFTDEELEGTFNSSYEFAIRHFAGSKYSDEQREASADTRRTRKMVHMMVVDYTLKSNKGKKMKRNEILKCTNKILTESGHKEMSEGTLKRYLSELQNYTSSEKTIMYRTAVNEYDSRRDKMIGCKDDHTYKIFERRFNTVNVNIIDEIRKYT